MLLYRHWWFIQGAWLRPWSIWMPTVHWLICIGFQSCVTSQQKCLWIYTSGHERNLCQYWIKCWKWSSTKSITGSFVVISELWPFCLVCSLDTQKYCCFTCEWDSRAKAAHYVTKDCTFCQNSQPSKIDAAHPQLVYPDKVYLPPLHIKPGLMKSFIQLWTKMAKVSSIWKRNFLASVMLNGIFVGPQFSEIMSDWYFY